MDKRQWSATSFFAKSVIQPWNNKKVFSVFKFFIKSIPLQEKKTKNTGSVSWYLLLLLHHSSNTGDCMFSQSQMEKSLVKLHMDLLLLNSLSKCPAAHSVEYSVTLPHTKPLKMTSYELSKDNSCWIINAKWLSAEKRAVRNVAVCQVLLPVSYQQH